MPRPFTLVVIFVILHISSTEGKQLGYFWQVSDFHYDANYSTTGNPQDMCHQGNSSSDNIGSYGNYLCDAPWQLITSAIEAMHKLHPEPDFILWTGDSVPHVQSKDLDVTKIYTLIGNVTEELMAVFPNTSIFPVLGNHDPYPANQMPYNMDQTHYYKGILDRSHWRQLLGHNESEQFLNGGYYSTQVSEKLRVIGLNTNLYYDQDTLTKDIDDPANQLQWLRQQLDQAQKRKEAVYIVAHVPPGVFELVENMNWFYPQFNKVYLELLNKYKDVITGQMYGHEHTDTFRVMFDENGKPSSSLFLSPAVTPWKSTLQGVGANNPSIRLYQYNRENSMPQKYMQYFLNLTAANLNLKAAPKWELEYDTSDVFGLDELRPQKLHDLVKGFDKNGKLFRHYLDYNSVEWSMRPQCNTSCFRRHYCAITQLDIENYKVCMSGGMTTLSPAVTTHRRHQHSTPAPAMPKYMYYVIGALAVVTFILFLIIAFMCINKRRRITPPRYSKFGSLSVNT